MSGGSARDHRALDPEDDRGPEAPTPGPSDQQNRNHHKGNRTPPTCAECGKRPVCATRSGQPARHCRQCFIDYIAAIRRRHAADLRLPPLIEWSR